MGGWVDAAMAMADAADDEVDEKNLGPRFLELRDARIRAPPRQADPSCASFCASPPAQRLSYAALCSLGYHPILIASHAWATYHGRSSSRCVPLGLGRDA